MIGGGLSVGVNGFKKIFKREIVSITNCLVLVLIRSGALDSELGPREGGRCVEVFCKDLFVKTVEAFFNLPAVDWRSELIRKYTIFLRKNQTSRRVKRFFIDTFFSSYIFLFPLKYE